MRKSNVPADPDALRAMGYDPENVPVRAIAGVLVGLAIFILASIAVGIFIYNFMVPNAYRLRGRGPEPPTLHRIPPHPQLQTYPKDEMHQYWAIDRAKLEQYGLADLQKAERDNFGSDAYPGSMKWAGGGEVTHEPAPAPMAVVPTPVPNLPAAPPPVEHLTGDKGFPEGSDTTSTPAPFVPAPVKLAAPVAKIVAPVATPAPAQVVAAQAKLTNEMKLQNIEFESGSATILPASTKILDEVAATLKQVAGTPVEIGGHTDSSGKAEANLTLSQDRANSVKRYLVDKGISIAQLTAKGYGSTKAIADNATPEGKQKNRRIEFNLKK
jgi:outer membrane protein OmpA-like peptidoglycan-associated protein